MSGSRSCSGRPFHKLGPAVARTASTVTIVRASRYTCQGVSWAQRAHSSSWCKATLVGRVGRNSSCKRALDQRRQLEHNTWTIWQPVELPQDRCYVFIYIFNLFIYLLTNAHTIEKHKYSRRRKPLTRRPTAFWTDSRRLKSTSAMPQYRTLL